jgi:hypothetical protein
MSWIVELPAQPAHRRSITAASRKLARGSILAGSDNVVIAIDAQFVVDQYARPGHGNVVPSQVAQGGNGPVSCSQTRHPQWPACCG